MYSFASASCLPAAAPLSGMRAASRRGSAPLAARAPRAHRQRHVPVRDMSRASAAGGVDVPTRRGVLLAGAAALVSVTTSPPPALAVGKLTYGKKVVAVISPTKGSSVKGTVVFTEATTRAGRVFTEVAVDLTGLKPGMHGINIHENGGVECDDGSCTGKSYNPGGLPHGDRDTIKTYGASAAHYNGDGRAYIRHAGDLGNVTADADGAVSTKFEDNVVAITNTKKQKAAKYNIIGRSVVIHAGEDNLVDEAEDGKAGPILGFGTIAA